MVEIKADLVWFITGTSSGFGRALVQAALARGDCVVATARTLSSIADLPETEKLQRMQLDVTEGFASLKGKLDTAVGFWGRIDVLVNNAGSGWPTIVEEGGTELLRRQFEVNVFGLLDVTNAVLPHMRARRSGTVVHIGSRTSWQPEIPGTGDYGASKAAVRVLAETMNTELVQFGIRTLIVEPGAFRTDAFINKGVERPTRIPDYDTLAGAIQKRLDDMPPFPGDPDKAMQLLVDVVRGEGSAKEKEWPLYLPMGEVAEGAIRTKSKRMIQVLDEWGVIIRDLNFDE